MDNATRLERLYRLLDVAFAHEEHDGHDTPLNGVSRNFHMNAWDCGTGACLLGSYVLTEYGKPFFRWNDEDHLFREPFLPVNSSGDVVDDAAEHFGIESEEAHFLFNPAYYDDRPIEPHHATTRVRELIARYDL